MSFPLPPINVSAPTPPLRILFPVFPVNTLDLLRKLMSIHPIDPRGDQIHP